MRTKSSQRPRVHRKHSTRHPQLHRRFWLFVALACSQRNTRQKELRSRRGEDCCIPGNRLARSTNSNHSVREWGLRYCSFFVRFYFCRRLRRDIHQRGCSIALHPDLALLTPCLEDNRYHHGSVSLWQCHQPFLLHRSQEDKIDRR